MGFGAEEGLGAWLILLVLIGFAGQTAFEDVLFRGRILQLAPRIRAASCLFPLREQRTFGS